MSKNIVIQEDGVSKNMTVDKLSTVEVGGGSVSWVPEDEAVDYANLGELYADENGAYYSADDNVAGYSQVVVNNPAEYIVGIDSDGNMYKYTVDDGQLVKSVQPASIALISPPTKTEYINGETIDYTGMVVKLYKGNGFTFIDTAHPDGLLSLSELTLTMQTAQYSGLNGDYRTSEFNTGYTQPIPSYTHTYGYAWHAHYESGLGPVYWVNDYLKELEVITTGNVRVMMEDVTNQSAGVLIFCAKPPGGTCRYTITTTNKRTGESTVRESEGAFTPDSNYHTYNGKPLLWSTASTAFLCGNYRLDRPLGEATTSFENLTPNPDSTGGSTDALAYTALYGDVVSGAATVTVPVSWTNQSTHQQFSVMFPITVTGGGA